MGLFDQFRSVIGDHSSGGKVDTEDLPDGEEIMAGVEAIELTPEQHQRVKDLVNGDQMEQFGGHDRRYLVAGAGGDSTAADRRRTVTVHLDSREDAMATRLEDFGLSAEEIELWCRVFDILCGRATHIVAVLEDFEGGYVWELGLLFAPSYRAKTWVLKRRYAEEATEKAKYANGMAVSHVEALLTGDRCFEWGSEEALLSVVEEIP